MIGGVATVAAVRTFPFRVFSFPKDINIGNWGGLHLNPYPGRLCVPNIKPDFHVREIWRSACGGTRAYFQGAYFINKDGIYEAMPGYWRKINDEIAIAAPPETYPWKQSGINFTSRDPSPERAGLSPSTPSGSTD